MKHRGRPRKNISAQAQEISLTKKQATALSSTADIVFMGGGNGGGKTQALMYSPIPYLGVPGFDAVLFHESVEKIKMAGGIRDRSVKLYTPLYRPGELPQYNKTDRKWTFSIAGFEQMSSVTMSFVGEPGRWDGLEACLIAVDQAEQVSQEQFFSLVGRCRSTCGAPERVFATVNPPDEGIEHWLTAMLVAGGWIGVDGFPVDHMDGVVRYFTRDGDEFIFANTAEELEQRGLLQTDKQGKPIPPKSVTFIQALVDDNEFGSPKYKQTLATLPEDERMRRLHGNWLVVTTAGRYFRSEYFPIVDRMGGPKARRVRVWDNAWSGSEKADWTVGVRMAIDVDGLIYIEDVLRFRGTAAMIERALVMVAELDGPDVVIRLPHDAGAAGSLQAEWANQLGARGYTVKLTRDVGDKVTRSKPYQACCERRQVFLSKSHISFHVARDLGQPWCLADGSFINGAEVSSLHDWHRQFVNEHVSFGKKSPSGRLLGKKDQVDAAVAGYLFLTDPENWTYEFPTLEPAETKQLMSAASKLFTPSRGLLSSRNRFSDAGWQ